MASAPSQTSVWVLVPLSRSRRPNTPAVQRCNSEVPILRWRLGADVAPGGRARRRNPGPSGCRHRLASVVDGRCATIFSTSGFQAARIIGSALCVPGSETAIKEPGSNC
jgi:hypothetical protein